VGLEWDCSHVARFTYDGSGARLSHSVTVPSGHPFAQQFWAGSCEEGQLTAGGFHDSKVHGKVCKCHLALLSLSSDMPPRTSGKCITIALAFYVLSIPARLVYVQRTLTAQSTLPVVSSLAWTLQLRDAHGLFMHNLRGNVFFFFLHIPARGLTASLDRFSRTELQVSSCRCPRRCGAGCALLAGHFAEEFGT